MQLGGQSVRGGRKAHPLEPGGWPSTYPLPVCDSLPHNLHPSGLSSPHTLTHRLQYDHVLPRAACSSRPAPPILPPP